MRDSIVPAAAGLGSDQRESLLQQLGRAEEARSSFDRAIALANSPAEAAHIRMHLDRLMQDGDAAARAAKSKRRMPPPVGRRGPRSS